MSGRLQPQTIDLRMQNEEMTSCTCIVNLRNHNKDANFKQKESINRKPTIRSLIEIKTLDPNKQKFLRPRFLHRFQRRQTRFPHQPLPPRRRIRRCDPPKTALELACPNTVSCSNILAVAVHDLLITLNLSVDFCEKNPSVDFYEKNPSKDDQQACISCPLSNASFEQPIKHMGKWCSKLLGTEASGPVYTENLIITNIFCVLVGSDSFWVAWIESHILEGRIFWTSDFSNVGSWI
ncbi:hypothetical protein YC2023_014870 [Brassica napus]